MHLAPGQALPALGVTQHEGPDVGAVGLAREAAVDALDREGAVLLALGEHAAQHRLHDERHQEGEGALDAPHDADQLEVRDDAGHPRDVFAVLEQTERFAERQVGREVEGDEVVHAHDVDGLVGRVCGVAEAGYEEVDVLPEEGLLRDEGFFGESVGDAAA